MQDINAFPSWEDLRILKKYHLDVAAWGHKIYDEIQFSHLKMKAIFDLVMNENLDLIATQLWQTCNMRCNLRFMKCNFKVYEMRNLRILKKNAIYMYPHGDVRNILGSVSYNILGLGYMQQNPAYKSYLLKRWEEIKRTFGDPLSIGDDIELQLPHKLARAWEDQEEEQGLPERESYHEIELSHSEMKAIFDPVVNENLDLIAAQLSQTHDIKLVLVVGGFAGSPYLMTRIKNSFAAEVQRIISPPNPGSAVCQGAVALVMNPGAIICRIARKTYGLRAQSPFEEGDPTEYCDQVGNTKMCMNRFFIYVQKGSQVAVDHCVTKTLVAPYPKQKEMSLVLYSSDDVSPRYTKGGSAEKEGELVIDISNVSGETDAIAEVSVSMYFGRSSIEMTAVGLNCGDKSKVHEMRLPLTFGGVLE